MKSMKPLKQLKLSVPAQETPITSFFTTQTLNGLLPESLYKRISSLGDPSILVVPVLDQWVWKGREIRKQELQDIIRELKNYKWFKHALELSTINSPEVCAALSCLLDFYKVRHLIKVELTSQKNLYSPINKEDSHQDDNLGDEETPQISKWESIIWISVLTAWIPALSEYLVNAIEIIKTTTILAKVCKRESTKQLHNSKIKFPLVFKKVRPPTRKLKTTYKASRPNLFV